jgi:sec-independent protein translocase protein TatA
MFGLGPGELLLVLILILIFYGGKKLPSIGEGLGKSIAEFRKSIRSDPGKDTGAPPVLNRTDGNAPRGAGGQSEDRVEK